MIGKQLGRWVIDRELGTGAMGKVYLTHAADAPEECRALKVLSAELARDPVARQRFQRESDVLCHLDHPNIVRFDGAGMDHDNLYYVMEYVAGPDCETRLHHVNRWPWSEVLDLAIQVTRGLKYAHDQGVVHRDLKPANILLSKNQNADTEPEDPADSPDSGSAVVAKIADFGVARMFSQGQLTGSGQFIGTALYMAPEQAAGKPATKRSDFYSLGCVLYTLLTGRPPFNGTTLAEMVHKHQFAQPERPARLLVDLPHDLDELIMNLLAKDPLQRPADGSVLLKRLESMRGKLVRKHNLPDTAFHTPLSKSAPKPEAWPVRDPPSPARTDVGKLIRAGILLIGFLACVAGIVYGVLRPRVGAEELFARAKPLMDSDNPGDWEKARREYLEPLASRFPDNPHKAEVEAFRQMLDDVAIESRLSQRSRRGGGRASEAQRFYEAGLQRQQAGDVDGARKLWRAIGLAFGSVNGERRWVVLAGKALADTEPTPADPSRYQAAREALEQARVHRDAGRKPQAEAIWQGLEDLYRDDAGAKTLLEEIKRDREETMPDGKGKR
jgi:serine/threonine-protein kinase